MQILYFAWVREAIGVDEESIDPPDTVRTVAELVDWLSTRSEHHAAAFADRGKLRAAVDQEMVAMDAAISGAREIAIFPPVTGG